MRIPVYHSVSKWQLSGVNTWACNLATAMTDDEDFEHIFLFTADQYYNVADLDSAGLSYAFLDLPDKHARRDEWSELKIFLEANAPCIYIPHYDFHRSATIPTLSADVKVCLVVHSDDPAYFSLVKRVGYASDALAAVSSYLSSVLKTDFPELAARVKYIASGVPASKESTLNNGAPSSLRLVYSNRLAQLQKRIFDLPLLVEQLSVSGVDFHLSIAGDGPDAAELIKRLDRCSGRKRVTMLGPLSTNGVDNLLAESDVFVLTSDFEGLPLSLLEAMAAGCVPVVYDIKSGVRDAIENGANGFLVPHGDVIAMARIIADLDANRMRLSSLAQACVRTHEERFALKQMAASYKSLFRVLMTGMPRGARRDGKIRLPRDLQLHYRLMRRLALK